MIPVRSSAFNWCTTARTSYRSPSKSYNLCSTCASAAEPSSPCTANLDTVLLALELFPQDGARDRWHSLTSSMPHLFPYLPPNIIPVHPTSECWPKRKPAYLSGCHSREKLPSSLPNTDKRKYVKVGMLFQTQTGQNQEEDTRWPANLGTLNRKGVSREGKGVT